MSSRTPFNALHVFAVAARLESFLQASIELHVTPGAVSRQIQGLEEILGTALFERTHRRVHLTASGKRLHSRIGMRLEAIADDFEYMRGHGRKSQVRLDCTNTFALHYLLARLGKFQAAHPMFEVQLRTSDGPVRALNACDLSIRRRPEEFTGFLATPFLRETSVLVAHPQFEHCRSRTKLKRTPRIGMRSRADLWPMWCAEKKVDYRDFHPTIELDNTILAIQAAVEGLGLLVVPELLVQELVSGGVLLVLDSTKVQTGTYHVVCLRQRPNSSVRKVSDWLCNGLS